ncbi:MAG: EMC3/TMCO1 family protein [Candidatus Hodarchaeales archaeon]|jgi:uncharacterized membrane protein (DUF106 family)
MYILQDVTKIMINLSTTPMIILQNITDAIPTKPPLSSIFILAVAFFVSSVSTLLSRKMIDIDKLRRLTRETKNYQKLRKQMLRTADSKLKLKYERNADRMRKVQSELTMMNLKPILIMFIPMILFFIVLSGYYGFNVEEGVFISGNIPAIIPFDPTFGLQKLWIFDIGRNINEFEDLGRIFIPNYIWWYFGGSLAFGSILRKISGLQPD